ncbi:MAG: hypothetical protein IJI22_00375 [Bacilli bacterium]|nr:hypothetical protein [Bacilli bacterium]
MIIGNNNTNNNFTTKPLPNFTKNSDEKFKFKKSEKKEPITIGKKSTDFYNINSKSDMADKSYAILQERYNNGLISLEEFTKKCQQLNKIRQK